MTAMPASIPVEREGAVAAVFLNRPDKLDALTRAMRCAARRASLTGEGALPCR
jgi:enoyl-CoA hydratase/carnithine racemase